MAYAEHMRTRFLVQFLKIGGVLPLTIWQKRQAALSMGIRAFCQLCQPYRLQRIRP